MLIVKVVRESQPGFRTGSGTVGTDVVRLGCGDAQQTVTVAASAGTFTLALAGGVTAAIAFNAAAADVQTALEAVVGSGNVAVSGSAGGPWTVSFKNAQGGQPQPAMVGDASKLTAADAQQTVTVTAATGGHFTLSLGAETTVNLAYNAAAADVQAALEALVAVGAGNVAVTGSAGGPWTVEFKGALAGQPVATIVATDVDLAGTGHAVAVAVAQAGGAAVSVAIVAPGQDVGGEVNKYVVVRANGANTGIILIGTTAANVGDGFILSAGQISPPIYVDQLNKVYLVGGAAGQGYSWIAC
jgi:hypothetical protein